MGRGNKAARFSSQISLRREKAASGIANVASDVAQQQEGKGVGIPSGFITDIASVLLRFASFISQMELQPRAGAGLARQSSSTSLVPLHRRQICFAVIARDPAETSQTAYPGV